MNKTVFVLIHFLVASVSTSQDPVAGILFLPNYPDDTNTTLGSSLQATYTKWLGQERIRWIPLYMDDPEEIWLKKIRDVNIIFLTGGGTEILNNKTDIQILFENDQQTFSKYGKWVQKTINEAVRLNEEGIYKPVWGTCLGFESMMLVLTNLTIPFATKLENLNVVLPVDFGYGKSTILNDYFSSKDFEIMRSEKLFAHNHHYGFYFQDALDNNYCQENLELHSITHTITDQLVLGSFSHRKYPFFAVQFHPEGAQFTQRDSYQGTQEGLELIYNRRMVKVLRGLIGRVSSTLSTDQIFEYRKGLVHHFKNGINEIFVNPNLEIKTAFF